MQRIRFTRDVTIRGVTGPNGHEDRLSFRVGETIDCEDGTAEHFVRRDQAVVVEMPVRAAKPAPAPVPEPEGDAGAEPVDLPETQDAEVDIAEAPRRRGRPRKDA